MIVLLNRQRKISVDTNAIKKTILSILKIVNYADFDVGILLTNNAAIRKLNSQYRSKDKPTDILSFSFYPDHNPKKRIKPPPGEEKNLGDLVLSLEYIKKDAEQRKQPFETRLKILLVHGICHLLGYDHETDADWRSMRAKEAYILKKL